MKNLFQRGESNELYYMQLLSKKDGEEEMTTGLSKKEVAGDL